SRLHFDAGGYWYTPNTFTAFNNPAGPPPQHLDAGVNARRARLGMLGTFMGDWNYAFIYDFGGTSDGVGGTASTGAAAGVGGTAVGFLPGGIVSGIQTAQLSYTGLKFPGVNTAIEGGYGDMPHTLDQAMSSNDIVFMERASAQLIATSFATGDFRS